MHAGKSPESDGTLEEIDWEERSPVVPTVRGTRRTLLWPLPVQRLRGLHTQCRRKLTQPGCVSTLGFFLFSLPYLLVLRRLLFLHFFLIFPSPSRLLVFTRVPFLASSRGFLRLYAPSLRPSPSSFLSCCLASSFPLFALLFLFFLRIFLLIANNSL